MVQLLGQWGHGAVQGNKGNAVAALLSLCPFLPPFSVGLFHLCFGVDELKSLVLKRENELWPRHVWVAPLLDRTVAVMSGSRTNINSGDIFDRTTRGCIVVSAQGVYDYAAMHIR